MPEACVPMGSLRVLPQTLYSYMPKKVLALTFHDLVSTFVVGVSEGVGQRRVFI